MANYVCMYVCKQLIDLLAFGWFLSENVLANLRLIMIFFFKKFFFNYFELIFFFFFLYLKKVLFH